MDELLAAARAVAECDHGQQTYDADGNFRVCDDCGATAAIAGAHWQLPDLVAALVKAVLSATR